MYPNYYNGLYSYYRNGKWNEKNDNQSVEREEVITFSQAVELIKQSIGDEKEDELFYDTIINQAPDTKSKNIIKDIRDDEKKHNQILRKLYYEFTGQMIPDDIVTTYSNPQGDYSSNLEKAFFGELDAVKKYRKIMGVMPSGSSYTLLMSIMTDELRHANKYNFLINTLK